MSEELYKENILDHYKNPRNKGKLENCHCHKESNPLCGDEIILYLVIEEGKIKEVKFEGYGCAISQASVSMLTEKLKGMLVEKAKTLTHDDIVKMLSIPISPVRMKCALLSLKTLHKGLEK
jgi:nitrogen fixation NifU-like protein